MKVQNTQRYGFCQSYQSVNNRDFTKYYWSKPQDNEKQDEKTIMMLPYRKTVLLKAT